MCNWVWAPLSSPCGPGRCVGQQRRCMWGPLTWADDHVQHRVAACVTSVQNKYVATGDSCRLIAQLDVDVRAGHVATYKAALFASASLSAPGLLYALLKSGQGHARATCDCVATVLTWGTCPHVLLYSGVSVCTPLWFDHRMNGCMPLFLAYGCIPALTLRRQGASEMWLPSSFAGLPQGHMSRQWAAWHCRPVRRRWVFAVQIMETNPQTSSS